MDRKQLVLRLKELVYRIADAKNNLDFEINANGRELKRLVRIALDAGIPVPEHILLLITRLK